MKRRSSKKNVATPTRSLKDEITFAYIIIDNTS